MTDHNRNQTHSHTRRRVVALLGTAAGGLGAPGAAWPQAPAKVSMDDAGARRHRLGAALRELNGAAGLGVAADDFEQAEAYVTGALLEVEQKLRPLPMDPGLDLPVAFRARRRA